jgi:hypothetical protein
VRWRPEIVLEEFEDEDRPDKPARQVGVMSCRRGYVASLPRS